MGCPLLVSFNVSEQLLVQTILYYSEIISHAR